MWCWRRLSRVPLTAKRSNQSVLKEINPKYSLEGLNLKLRLQYFGHLIWRVNSLEKHSLMLAKIEGRREWEDVSLRNVSVLAAKTMETVTDFIFLGSKITADGDCNHEIKRCLLLVRKAMINLDIILKSRDITLVTRVHLVKAMVLPVVMYGCESWIVKKAECQRTDAFEPWCWRRLLRVPWTAKKSNQSILKEISPGCSLEGLMLKLKLQYFCHLMWRGDSLEKTLMLGKIEGRWRMG